MKGAETIFGLHAVRVMLERHPERVHTVRIAERRGDPRVRAIDELARRHHRPVERGEAHPRTERQGEEDHENNASEDHLLTPRRDYDNFIALNCCIANDIYRKYAIETPE